MVYRAFGVFEIVPQVRPLRLGIPLRWRYAMPRLEVLLHRWAREPDLAWFRDTFPWFEPMRVPVMTQCGEYVALRRAGKDSSATLRVVTYERNAVFSS